MGSLCTSIDNPLIAWINKGLMVFVFLTCRFADKTQGF